MDVRLNDSPAAEPEDDAADLLLRAKAWFKLDHDHAAEWRREAREDYDFVAGRQWSDEDRAKLADELRPVITFNRIQPTIDAVVGLEIGNRREVRFIPRELGDAKANEVLTAAGQWARDECDAEDEETDMFADLVTCGMGWTETRFDYEEDPDGKLVVERIDPLEMLWDCAARKRNLADARRLWRVRLMPLAEARGLFPDADDGELDAAWAREERSGPPHNADPDLAYRQDAPVDGPDRDRAGDRHVTIVHLQWWEREPYWRVAFNGRVEDVADADFAAFKARAGELAAAGLAPPLRAVRQTRRRYRQAFLGGRVLEAGPSPCAGHFTWECVTGKRDHASGTFFGLVRGMKDPQRWANKWLAQSLHILNSNAKGGLLAERGAFDNDADAEETYARPDRITWVKAGKLAAGAVQPKTPAAFPAGFDNLLQFAIASLRDVSGVNLELLGLRDATQAGVLEEHRKQAGMTILAGLFDALRRYRKRQGRILLWYIVERLSDGRLIRIVGEAGAQYVPLIRQAGTAAYDVIVDDSPTSPNQKEKVWATLLQLMPMLSRTLGPEDWSILAEFSPLPASLVERWRASQEARRAEQQPKAAAAEAMLEERHRAALAKTLSEADRNAAAADWRRAEATAGREPGWEGA